MLLLTFLHILGSIRHVAKDVNELKDTAKNLTGKVEDVSGKHIRLTFRFAEIHLVNYQENNDHFGNVTLRNIYTISDSFLL